MSVSAARATRSTAPSSRSAQFDLARTVGSLAAGEIEEAFEHLLAELRAAGVRRGTLLVAERDELVAIAGDELATADGARVLTLHDGYDVVGEIRLELASPQPLETLELVQDLFGLGLGRRVRGRELTLMRAAVAVNAAKSFDQALEVLAETCCRITDTPMCGVIVWEPGFEFATVRAGAGDALRFVGERLFPGANSSYQAATTGSPVIMHGPRDDGLGPRTAAVVARHACGLAVPLRIDGEPRIVFHMAWPEDPGIATIERAVAVVEQLGALTSVAYLGERERVRAAQDAILRTVVEAVPDGVWIRHGDHVTLNFAARELLDLHGIEPHPDDDYDVRRLDGTPLDEDEWPSSICMRTKAPARDRLLVRVRDTDRIVDFSVAPIPNGYVGILRDVTEEQRERTLTERFLERLFAAMPVAAAVTDPERGEILSVNRAFEQLVGRPADEIVGLSRPYPWWADDHQEWHDETSFERVFRRPDGGLVAVEGRAFSIADGDAARRRVSLFSDLTERRELERQLVQSGKLAAIGELASGVAHEINNPLFAILGLVEFLLRDAEPGTKAHERLQLIQQTGLEIKEIVKALLDFARERTDEHRPLLLRDTVAEALALIRRASSAKAVEIVERFDDDSAPVLGSPNQIKQIVLNLISNAQQAMPDGGTITVEIVNSGDWVEVAVSDTGSGIPASVLPRVFEPFFTTKRDLGGTGLGLAVSHGIAEMHGGTLVAESEPGHGAVFRLRLPRAAEEG
jgi:PAS domain S-box-containing protein